MNTENANNSANNIKTTVFNLIILDESGSMLPLKEATISGCNETIDIIRAAQQQAGDSQRHLVSIYAFQNGGSIDSRYLIKNTNVADVNNITDNDYHPYGWTPLYDAVGMTLTDLEAIAATHEDATGVVTIITDGYENSSREYDSTKVAKIILDLKEKGWTFNFIGANVDVEKISRSLNIDNSLSWQNNESGTKAMFNKFQASYSKRMQKMADMAPCASVEERIAWRKKTSNEFFD